MNGLWIALGVAVAGGVAYAFLATDLLSPGGMRAIQGVQDHDPRLTREARAFKPVVDALARHQASRGAYPATLAELDAKEAQEATTLTYTRLEGGRGYTLSKRLGWDPSLTWTFDGTAGTWAYDPGDGSPGRADLKLAAW